MRHPDSEELLSHYYEREGAVAEHLLACSNCRNEFRRLEHWLDEVRETSTPEPDGGYEARLWARVRTELPQKPTHRWVWAAGCAAAAALVLMFVQLRPSHIEVSKVAKPDANRVVHAALSDYLGQTQVLLTEISHHSSTDDERARARELVEDGRLLRAALRQHGDDKRAMVLDDLEPALLTVANGPEQMKADEWKDLQTRVRDSGLVFKVAVIRSNLTKGSPL